MSFDAFTVSGIISILVIAATLFLLCKHRNCGGDKS